MNVSDSKLFLERPQGLCKMCGRCCRCSTTAYSHAELLRMKENGNEGACDFLELFEPYESLDEAKKVDNLIVENILNRTADVKSEEDYTFINVDLLEMIISVLFMKREKFFVIISHLLLGPWFLLDVVMRLGCFRKEKKLSKV